MMKPNYKKKYEELLIKQHERKYIHIPFSWKAIGRFSAFLGSVGLAIANFFLIISTWNMLGLKSLSETQDYSFSQLLIVYPLIGEYILVSLTIICLTALIKGGFDKLKSYKKEGLLGGLLGGLLSGLLFGLLFGLFFGLIIGLISGLIIYLILGMIIGLISGLIIGLIIGMMSDV